MLDSHHSFKTSPRRCGLGSKKSGVQVSRTKTGGFVTARRRHTNANVVSQGSARGCFVFNGSSTLLQVPQRMAQCQQSSINRTCTAGMRCYRMKLNCKDVTTGWRTRRLTIRWELAAGLRQCRADRRTSCSTVRLSHRARRKSSGLHRRYTRREACTHLL